MKPIGKRYMSVLTALFTLGWYAGAVGLVVMAGLAVFSLFGNVAGAEMDIPVSFAVDVQPFHVAAPALGIERAEVESIRANGNLKFPVPSRLFLASTAAGASAALAIVLWALSQLRAVFRTVRDGHPFVAANSTRIRRIAYVVIFGELGRYAVVLAGNRYAMRQFSAEGLRFDLWPTLNVLGIVAGLIILVIAEVFREGARLDEEQSLTV